MSSNATGTVTAIGLDIKANTNAPTMGRYLLTLSFCTYQPYAAIVSKENNTHNKLFLSAAHATVSTFKGCTAKSAAAIKLRQVEPVPRVNNRNNRNALIACSTTLTK